MPASDIFFSVSMPDPSRDPGRAMSTRAKTLRIDWGTSEVLRSFEAADVECLLLKGATFARWLYSDDDPRPYGDADLLVRPGAIDRAREALAELGFEPTIDEGQMPDWWREHAVEWLRHSDAVAVDLHHTLEGVGVDDETLWRTLAATSEPVEVAGYPAPALAVPGRAFHVALHAAQHGSAWGPVVDELELAIGKVPTETWAGAAALAAELQATPAFAAGLRLAPSGPKLADELGLALDQSVGIGLRAQTPPPVALGFDQLAQASGLRARMAILWHKLFPPPTFMRKWSPRARQGRFGLALAYAWRPIWLLKKAPAGFRAWRAARGNQPPAA
jgi:hypothetical protein